jgi:hypothetical protein
LTSDNLKDINGIGPKTLKTLKAANINTLEQLSTLKVNDLQALDGIGTTKAKQFINEAKKKLKTSEALSEGHYSQKRNSKEVIESILLPKLKRDIMEGILDSDLFQDLIKNEIQNYLRKQERSIKGKHEHQSGKITHLKEQIEDLKQQISSLRALLNDQYSSDDSDKISSDQTSVFKAAPNKSKIDKPLETSDFQKPQMMEKAKKSKEEEIISKSLQSLEDIEDYIKYLLNSTESIEVDELIKKEQLQTVSLSKLKKAIYNLIDKNIIIPTESSTSIQKINGKIWRLTRVK